MSLLYFLRLLLIINEQILRSIMKSLHQNRISLDSIDRSKRNRLTTREYENEYTFMNRDVRIDHFESLCGYLNQISRHRGKGKGKTEPSQRSGLPSLRKQKDEKDNGLERRITKLLLDKMEEKKRFESCHYSNGQGYGFQPYQIYYNPIQQPQYLQPSIPAPMQYPKHYPNSFSPTNVPQTLQNKKSNEALHDKSLNCSKMPVTKNKKKNKFRIIGYAVFFCLLFPQYSHKFRQIRLKNQKSQPSPSYSAIQSIVLPIMSKYIDLMKIYRTVTSGLDALVLLDWQQLTNTALVPKQQLSQQQALQIQATQIINSTQSFLLSLQTFVFGQLQDEDNLQEWFRTMAKIVGNGSLITNVNAYYPQQYTVLKVDQNRSCLLFDANQKLHVVLGCLYRVFVEKFVIQLKSDLNYRNMVIEVYGSDKLEIEGMIILFSCVTAYLHIIVSEMHQSFIQNSGIVSNFEDYCRTNQVLGHQILGKFDDGSKQGLLETGIKVNYLKKINKIMAKSDKLRTYTKKVKDILLALSQNIVKEIHICRKKYYESLKELTLLNKRLIFHKQHTFSQTVLKNRNSIQQKQQFFERKQKIRRKMHKRLNSEHQKPMTKVQKIKAIHNQVPLEGKYYQEKRKNFNLDIINVRSQQLKQDQLMQRFRHLLAPKPKK